MLLQVRSVDGVVPELDRIVLLEPLLDVRHNAVVEARLDVVQRAFHVRTHFAVVHDDLAVMNDVPRHLEHSLNVVVPAVDRDVRIRSRTEMSFALQAKDSGW